MRQYERYGKEVGNGFVLLEELLATSPLTPSQQNILQNWGLKKGFSNRMQIKLIRLARTIADLNGSTAIKDSHSWEALTLRREVKGRETQPALLKHQYSVMGAKIRVWCQNLKFTGSPGEPSLWLIIYKGCFPLA
jgi:hypothetical protein